MISRLFKSRGPVRRTENPSPTSGETSAPLQKITVRNNSGGELCLSIEPNPDHYKLPPKAEVEVLGRELRCNHDGSLDITQEQDNFLVLWLDDAEVFHKGRKLKPWGEPLEYD